MPARSPDDADSVRALVRGFEVLDCYAAARRPLGTNEVAELTGIPKPTVSRLIATLAGLGHLRPAAQGTAYELAAGVVRLAEAFLGAIDVRHHARPHVVQLAEECNASCEGGGVTRSAGCQARLRNSRGARSSKRFPTLPARPPCRAVSPIRSRRPAGAPSARSRSVKSTHTTLGRVVEVNT